MLVGVNLYLSIQEKKNVETKYYNYYTESANNDSSYIVVFGRTGCSYCKQYVPVLESILKESNLTYAYINVELLDSDVFNAMLDKAGISTTDFGTPTTIIIRSGKVVASKIGYMNSDDTTKFLKDSGVLK